MQQRHVGPTVAQQPFLLTDAGQQHLHPDRVRLGGVRVEQFRQQLARRPRLRRQHEPGAAVRGLTGAAGTAVRGVHRVQGRAALAEQHRSGPGERDAAAVPFEQRHAEAPFELADRPRQRRLGDAQAARGAAEVQFLGDRDEVAKLPRLHPATVPPD